LIVDLFIWALTLIPVPQVAPYARASGVLAWIAVVLLTIILLHPQL
jgi:hypothetical protein